MDVVDRNSKPLHKSRPDILVTVSTVPIERNQLKVLYAEVVERSVYRLRQPFTRPATRSNEFCGSLHSN